MALPSNTTMRTEFDPISKMAIRLGVLLDKPNEKVLKFIDRYPLKPIRALKDLAAQGNSCAH
jgi:hypothetical protein